MGSVLHDGGPLVARASGSTTVASLFVARARIHPDRLAVEDRSRKLTYGELADRTRRLAGALAARGVRRGTLRASDLFERCRAELAGFKQPKGIAFIAFEAFPRSASGKVQRHELEKMLAGTTVVVEER